MSPPQQEVEKKKEKEGKLHVLALIQFAVLSVSCRNNSFNRSLSSTSIIIGCFFLFSLLVF